MVFKGLVLARAGGRAPQSDRRLGAADMSGDGMEVVVMVVVEGGGGGGGGGVKN